MNANRLWRFGAIFMPVVMALAALIIGPSRIAFADSGSIGSGNTIYLPAAGDTGTIDSSTPSCQQLLEYYDALGQPCPCNCPTPTPTPVQCTPTPYPQPTAQPFTESGHLIQQDSYCNNVLASRYMLLPFCGASDAAMLLSCLDSLCGPLVGQWVTITWQLHSDCLIGGRQFAVYHVETIRSEADPCPQPTPTATPSVQCDSDDWVFDWTTLGAPEQCRYIDSHDNPIRFNIEKRLLLPGNVTPCVENSFYLMGGYTGQVVGEGDFTIYCADTPEAVIRQDMLDHMARRRLDPGFIADRKTICEVTVQQARDLGILRDTCDGVTACEKMVERDRRDPQLGTWLRWGDADTYGLLEHWRNWGGDQRLYTLLLEPGQVYDIHGGGTWYSTPCEYEARNEFARVSAIRIPITIADLERSGLAKCVVGSRDCPRLLVAGDQPISQ